MACRGRSRVPEAPPRAGRLGKCQLYLVEGVFELLPGVSAGLSELFGRVEVLPGKVAVLLEPVQGVVQAGDLYPGLSGSRLLSAAVADVQRAVAKDYWPFERRSHRSNHGGGTAIELLETSS